MASSEKTVPGFHRLSFNTYISQPSKSISNPSNPTAPNLILLHTWLNALPKHIAKYTLTYRTLYPSATILLTTSSWQDWAYRSKASQDASLSPVLEYILSLPPTSRILLHLFSNGGAWTATQVAMHYKQKTGKPLPISKMILDSSPGIGGYRKTTTAFAVGLPSWRTNPIIRIVGFLAIHVGFCIAHIIGSLIGGEQPAILLRRRLNDKTIFSGAAARLYIYGDKDIMIPSDEVKEHALWAEAAGWKVSQERYVDSGHVMHAVVDPKRYWAAVGSHWDEDVQPESRNSSISH